jgi:sulfoxide reductase heme-binding subunit YedZ
VKSVRALLLHPAAKPVVLALCLLPLAWLVYGAASDQLGANPAEALIRSCGDWTLRFLCLTLAITPLRIRTGRRSWRAFGACWACSPSSTPAAICWPTPGWTWGWMRDIGRDILKRPFILVGFACWLLLLPLALTSFNRAVRWLGGRQWQALHRLVYLIAGLALLHFFWMRAGKNDFAEVQVYAMIIGALLLERLLRYFTPRPRLSAR